MKDASLVWRYDDGVGDMREVGCFAQLVDCSVCVKGIVKRLVLIFSTIIHFEVLQSRNKV